MTDTANVTPIRERIDNAPMVFNQYLIIFICFLLNVADGFDVIAMSVAAPSVSAAWQIDAKSLGVIFSSALAGMTIGAMFLAPLSDKIGRRTVILGATAAISISMFATAYATSVMQLVIIRFIAGLGIGGVLASATSMATEFSPKKHSSFSVIFVQTGYSVGAVIVGLIAASVITQYGWEQLFIYGGVLSGVLFFLVLFFVPESIEHLASKQGDEAKRLQKINKTLIRIGRDPFDVLPVSTQHGELKTGNITSLLNKDFRGLTLRLWSIFFLAFWASYFLVNWIPKLFVNAGFDIKQGIFALTVYTVGGMVGALSLGAISARLKLTNAIVIMFFISAVLLAIYTQIKPQDLLTLYAFMAVISFALTGGFTGLYAVAAQSYPTEIRATGVGWCIGLGRSGAIISPIVAGYMVAAGWGMYSLFLVLAIPAIILSGVLIKGIKA